MALKLFSGAERYAPINNVAGFVYQSIRNRIIDIMRGGKQEVPISFDSEFNEHIGSMNDTLKEGFSEREIGLLKAALGQLKPAYRDIILAIDFEGFSYKEISNETGIPEGTLMSRRHRALGILNKKIASNIKRNE